MRDRVRRLTAWDRPARRFRAPPPARPLSGWRAARAKVRAKFAAHAAERWFVIGGPSCTDNAYSVKRLTVVKYGDFWYTKGLAEVRGASYGSERAAIAAAKKTVTGRVARLEQDLVKAKRNLKRLEKRS